MKGYQVFKANHPEEEFTEVTIGVWPDTVFVDTVNLNTLTEKVYYKVISSDYRYNRSKDNQIIEVQRPDIVPPVAPVITSYEAEEKYISFEWIPSSSTDVRKYEIFRKDFLKAPWQLLHRIDSADLPLDPLTYYDSLNLIPGKGYQYKIEAADEADNRSEVVVLKVQTLDREMRAPVKISAEVDRKKHFIRLKWADYPRQGVERFVIYRAAEDKPLKIYSSVNGSLQEYFDRNIPINKTYSYMVQARFYDGAESEFIPVLQVKY